jgi:hypothetical protein
MIYWHGGMAGQEIIKARLLSSAGAFIAWRTKANGAEAMPRERPFIIS